MERFTSTPELYYIHALPPMPPAVLDPIILNTSSVAGFQSESSELNSAIFNDPKLDEQFDMSSSTNATSTSKKRKLQAVNMWSFAEAS